MTEKVLFVDDEDHILQSIKRQLRKRFQVYTALGGEEALVILKNEGPFAVIVSDMRMPGIDGIQLLTKVRDLYPDIVRLMLTGNADQETAIEAVNKGQIFRFLSKPCPTATLVTSIALAQRQHRLLIAEKDLLDNTLKGSVKVLSELLSLANPAAFSSGYRIKGLVSEMAAKLSLHNTWQLEISSLMSQIGCITLPTEILNKLYAGRELEFEEEEMYLNHPKAGARLLENIPRLETVVGIIENQLKTFSEIEEDTSLAYDIALGAQILKIAIDHDFLQFRGLSHNGAVGELNKSSELYNPKVLEALKSIKVIEDHARVVSLNVIDITVGMIAEENIVAQNGVMIAPKGQKITWPVLQGITNFSRQVGVKEPLVVRIDKGSRKK
jgi:response regulator RpfG family c-di-GMP phosphodiesterase